MLGADREERIEAELIKVGEPVFVRGHVHFVDDGDELLAGCGLGARAAPGSPAYQKDSNPSAHVLKTFTAADWKEDNGWKSLTFQYQADKNQYLRLRGSNLGQNVAKQTHNGDPLMDDLVGKNNAAQAWADLWFYSNPIFIQMQP